MYESSQMILTPRVYTLEELHHLCQTEGNFDDEYQLITKKTLIAHIRFPGLSKTAIEVYPEPRGQSAIVVNLTKASRGKDFLLSVVTDGWSDALSTAQNDNMYKITKIIDEFKRLTNLSTDSPSEPAAAPAVPSPAEQAAPQPSEPVAPAAATPPAPAPTAPPPVESSGLPAQTETYSGFKTLRTVAYDDHMELIHEKKNKTIEIMYTNISKLESKKDTMTFTFKVGGVEVIVFKSNEECAEWDTFIRSKM